MFDNNLLGYYNPAGVMDAMPSSEADYFNLNGYYSDVNDVV